MLISEVFDIDVIFIVVLIASALYYYGVKPFNHFESRGIKYFKPVPYFGNTIKSTLNLKHVALCTKDLYERAKGEDFIGIFLNRTPNIMIINPQLIQSICVKDFTHFYNRGRNIDATLDPLRAYNLVNLSGQRWKTLRQKLTPAFSSGKLKVMFEQFNDCGNELLKCLKNLVASDKPIDVGEVMVNFTTDVIGTCAFGMQFNSLKDPDSYFRKVAREMVIPSFGIKAKTLLLAVHEKLPDLLNIRMFHEEYNKFFKKFVKDTIQFREDNNIERNDFIQILMSLVKEDLASTANNSNKTNNDTIEKSGDQILLDDQVLAANTFVFFIAGFETTASTLRNCLFELSLSHNLSIQQKLRQEVLTTIGKHGNKITDDTIKDMHYLEQVVAETLRKYPVAPTLVRKCTKPYNIPGTSIIINQGERVLIPVYSIHHDPEHYPEPDVFDPERFNEQNKKSRPNFTYLPFGDGPRACIGSRFALLEIKCALAKVLSHYEFTFSNVTTLPLKWDPRRVLLFPEQQVFLDFKLYNKSM